MVAIHIVLFKFRADTAQSILHKFSSEIWKLRSLPCVLDQRLVLGGPSITTPEHRSKGFQYCLLSYHENRAALDEYQASPEHHHVTSNYMWPFNEDLIRFDFEADNDILGKGFVEKVVGGTPDSWTGDETSNSKDA